MSWPGPAQATMARHRRRSPLAAEPLRWLQGAQLAVGKVLRGDGPRRVVLDVAELDRPNAFSVVVEVLDLLEGLRDAGRLHVLTLSELTDS